MVGALQQSDRGGNQCSGEHVFFHYDRICHPCLQLSWKKSDLHLHFDDHDDPDPGDSLGFRPAGIQNEAGGFVPSADSADNCGADYFYYIKQYMESNLPLSLVEAARIDGSGEFHTFNHIVLPLMKPAIAVQMIFTFVTSWNNYFTPALILHDEKKKTLPILIAQLRSADFLKFDMGQVYIMIVFSILPVVIVYLFLSKYIVAGVAAGSVKG